MGRNGHERFMGAEQSELSLEGQVGLSWWKKRETANKRGSRLYRPEFFLMACFRAEINLIAALKRSGTLESED